MSRRVARLVLLGLAAAALPAAAADAPLWELGLGVAGLRLPHYRGAQEARSWLLPVPYAVYRGEILRANRDGVKAMLLDSDLLDFDISLSATAPTRSADEPARQGMPDLKATVEVGPNLNLRLARGSGWKAELRLPVRAAFTLQSDPRHVGWSAMPSLSVDHRVRGWNLGVQAAWVWGNRALNGYFYDVPQAYATAARPAYRADGGQAGWQGTLSLSRRIDNHWVGAYVRTDSMAGSSLQGSPLVQRTRTTGFGFAYSWVLWHSTQRVPDRDEYR